MSQYRYTFGNLLLGLIILFSIAVGVRVYMTYSAITLTMNTLNAPTTPTVTEEFSSLVKQGIEDLPNKAWIGYVGDALARPIPDARISLGTDPGPDAPFAISDDRGKFLLLLPADTFPLVTVQADGYYPFATELEEGEGGTYTLYRGGLLEGQVRGHIFVLRGEKTPEPAPIPAARLEIAGVNGWSGIATADEEGRYKITVPPGKIVATVRSPKHADARFDNIEIHRDEVLSRDMILAAGVILDGFVLGDNTTLKGARVRVFNEMKDEADVIAEDRGAVRIEGLSAGFAKVLVVHPGYQEQIWEIIVPSDRIGMRKPFSLLKSEPFELAVTNEHSQSLPDARIRIKRDGLVVVDTTADDTEGLQVLAAGRTYQIEARHTHIENGKSIQLPPKAFRYTMPESGPGKLAIELRPGGRISGTILDPNGSPVFGASILVRTKDSKDAAPPRLLKTNRAGVFRSQPFAAGRWILTINHPQIGTMTTETVVEINKNQSVGTLRFSRK